MSDATLEVMTEQKNLLKEQNRILEEQNKTLKEIMAFWTRIVSDDYFNEMMKQEGHRFPK